MKLRFLLDAHITPRLKGALLRYDRTIEIMRLGDPGMPPLNTLDPEILAFTAQSQQVLVTEDYTTIPTHADDHMSSGGHHPGILLIRPGSGIRDVAEALYELWYCSEAEEWIDLVRWIPL